MKGTKKTILGNTAKPRARKRPDKKNLFPTRKYILSTPRPIAIVSGRTSKNLSDGMGKNASNIIVMSATLVFLIFCIKRNSERHKKTKLPKAPTLAMLNTPAAVSPTQKIGVRRNKNPGGKKYR